MKQVTRDIDPSTAQDLLKRVPRACLSFAGDTGPQVTPVSLQARDGYYLVGIPLRPGNIPATGQEVVLLVDEGIFYFDLRAIYIRGQVKPAQNPPATPANCVWFEVTPMKTVAWDYGRLREVSHEP